MTDVVLREVAKDVWAFSRPLTMGFIPVGGRSVAIKLLSGDVWVMASTPLTPETKTKLDELGEVRYIVSASAGHWLFLAEFKKAYPSAKVIGPEPLLTKKGCVALDGVYGRDSPDTKYGFEDEITPCFFSGVRNKEVAFHHVDSKTLVVADLLFHFPATEQYSNASRKPFLLKFGLGLNPTGWLHQRVLSSFSVDREAVKDDAKTVASWNFNRIIPCHGDVIENKANEAWRSAYAAYLK